MTPPRIPPPETPAILSFRGPDAVRFLNGQVTQDVSSLGERSLPTCVTDAKGRLQYVASVTRGVDDDSIWLVCPRSHAEGLFERIDRYLIADEVEIEDLGGRWTRLHLPGPPAEPPATPAFSRSAEGIFGEGLDLWFPAGEEPVPEELSEAETERLRIARGMPAWGTELQAGMLPPEAGLDRSAISYTKGCYIGQEVLSRIKSARKVNRRLARFELDAPVDAPAMLHCLGNLAGELTSAAEVSPPLALGFLKRSAQEERTFAVVDAANRTLATARWLAWA